MGKKEKKSKELRGKKNKHKFSEPLLKKLEEAGLDTQNLIFCCTGDMDNDACYRSAWLSFDEKGFYVAYGTEKLVKSKRKKHVEPEFTVEEIIATPIEDIDLLETERYVSTGRLVAVRNGEQRSVVRFSVGKLGQFDNLTKAFNSFKEKVKRKFLHRQNPKKRNAKNAASLVPTVRTSAKSAARIQPLRFVFSSFSAAIFRR